MMGSVCVRGDAPCVEKKADLDQADRYNGDFEMRNDACGTAHGELVKLSQE